MNNERLIAQSGHEANMLYNVWYILLTTDSPLAFKNDLFFFSSSFSSLLFALKLLDLFYLTPEPF